MLETLARRGEELTLIQLWLARLGAGEGEVLRDDGEMCAVVLSGSVDVTVDNAPLGTAARDGDVFDGAGDAAYAPAGSQLELVAVSDAVVAVAAAPVEGVPGPARLIRPADQDVRSAGAGNWARRIRTILGPADAAGRLVVGETINPPGNWSSYPPHKHDRQAPPDEVAQEEVYVYRFKPAGGFGVQLRYDDAHEDARIVHDGDVVAIPAGYHPVVAAPGYELYYLWVIAGASRELVPFFDPQHAWVQSASPS
ncbi:MAG TPA: 5-deoxy-glucuronate isomerase [Gaiellaceae bacterium]|nr:5-deoxy-glucuronate isomerase [Gaiellaceae bacterium]